MANYYTDGKKLLNVEYDTLVEVGDVVDNMRVLSTNTNTMGEYCVFLLEPLSRKVICYIFDEVFIIGKSDSFDDLTLAVEAWNNNEI